MKIRLLVGFATAVVMAAIVPGCGVSKAPTSGTPNGAHGGSRGEGGAAAAGGAGADGGAGAGGAAGAGGTGGRGDAAGAGHGGKDAPTDQGGAAGETKGGASGGLGGKSGPIGPGSGGAGNAGGGGGANLDPCASAPDCRPGERRCEQGLLAACLLDESGCPYWGPPPGMPPLCLVCTAEGHGACD